MPKLCCLHHKLPLGVVAFFRSGQSLNSEVRPGEDVELTYGPDHTYLVAVARVLSVHVTQVNDIPPRLVAYNQDHRGRDLSGLKNTLGIDTCQDATVTLALLDVFEIPDRDESDRHVVPETILPVDVFPAPLPKTLKRDEMGLNQPKPDDVFTHIPKASDGYRDTAPPVEVPPALLPPTFPEIDTPGRQQVADLAKKLAQSKEDEINAAHHAGQLNDGPTNQIAHQSEDEIPPWGPDEDEIIGEMGDRLRAEDEPGPHNVLTPEELAEAAASDAGRAYAEDEAKLDAERDQHFSEEHELAATNEGMTLPVDPSSHRAPRPDEDDELVEAEVEEYDEDYDDDLDDWDDDDLDDSELEELMGDIPDPREN